jgi:hypothetical protein
MRSALVAVFGIAAWSLSYGSASADTPEELLQSCEAVLQVTLRSGGRDADIPAEGLPCWHYMSAVQNMSVLVDERGDLVAGLGLRGARMTMNAKMRAAIVTISASVTKTISLCMRCFIEACLNGTILKLVRFIV